MLRLLAFLFVLALGVAAAPAALAQSGKISGTVRDASGETLIGVNVRIEGTTQGASSDVDGRYTIIGVRPGEYAVTFSYIGYQTRRVESVRVRIDLTTTVDAELAEESVEGDALVVQADRALFQRDVTATTATVSGEEIRAIPVENFADVVALQAGVVQQGGETHFRGGRGGEVGYWVDGVPVTDVFSGNLALSIENESVQEVQVVTGAFNAEYGQALSGIVNIVTRDGSNDVTGEVEVWSGDYLGRESATSAGIQQTGPGTDLLLFPGVGAGDFQPFAVRNLEGAIGGPILRDRLFFFGSTRYFANDGYLTGRRVYTLDDVGFDDLGRLASLGASGDSSAVLLNPYEKLSGQFKLTANLPFGLRLTGNFLSSTETFRNGGLDQLYLPDVTRTNRNLARTSILKLTHLLSATTFYEVGLTNNYSRFRNFLFEDPLDDRYRDPQFLGYRDPQFTSGFALGGTDNGRFRRSTNTWLLKADVSSQVHPSHLVKTGIEVRRHDLSFLDEFTFRSEVPGQEIPAQLIRNGDYDYAPTEFAAYLQDKIEVGGLIINAGLRFDYFNSNGVVFANPTDPGTVFPGLRACAQVLASLQCATDANGDIVLRPDAFNDDGSPNFTPDGLFEAASASYQISPRLGVAFPITEGGVVHFSYGQFFQTPNFELLYQNPYFQLSSAGSGLVGLIGNANLRPEQTINGEIGLKQELSSNAAVEVTAYYRDIRNLAGTATNPIVIEGTGARYGQLVNSDFGIVRGVILRFDQRIGRAFYAGVDYTFQTARANASDPSQVFNAAAARQQLETQIVPTNWDQRHTVNGSLTYTNQRLDAGFGLLLNYGSGSPYTPARTSRVTGGTVPPSVIPLNSESRPAFVNVNLTAYRNFAVGPTRFQLWTKVDNVFDTRNETGIFGDTGRATYSLEQSIEGANFLGDPSILAQRYVRPDFFSAPRRVVLGARFNF